MNNLDQLRGRLRFGQGLGAGLGMPVAIDTGTDQLADANLRPAGDLAKGPNGELLPTRVPYIEIRILAGRDGPKYAWEQVHPNPDGISTDINGGDTEKGFFAYEMTGRTNVPAGAIVPARYSPTGPWLLFRYDGIGHSGPSGPGGLNTVSWTVLTLIDGQCVLVTYSLTGPDLTLGVNIDLPEDASGP